MKCRKLDELCHGDADGETGSQINAKFDDRASDERTCIDTKNAKEDLMRDQLDRMVPEIDRV